MKLRCIGTPSASGYDAIIDQLFTVGSDYKVRICGDDGKPGAHLQYDFNGKHWQPLGFGAWIYHGFKGDWQFIDVDEIEIDDDDITCYDELAGMFEQLMT